jgi:predicted Zn-dependent protease
VWKTVKSMLLGPLAKLAWRRAKRTGRRGSDAKTGGSYLERHVQRHPTHAEGWRLLAAWYGSVGDYEGAEVAARRGLIQCPGSDLWIELAYSLQKQNRIDELEEVATDAAQRHPEDAFPWVYLAGVAWARGQKGQMEDAASEAFVRLDPRGRTYPHYRLGVPYSVLPGGIERALSLFSKATTGRASDSNVFASLLHLSVLHESRSDWHADWYLKRAKESERRFRRPAEAELAEIRAWYEEVGIEGAKVWSAESDTRLER